MGLRSPTDRDGRRVDAGRQWAEPMRRTGCEGGRADAGWRTWLARHLGFKPGRRKVGRRVWGKRTVYVGRKGGCERGVERECVGYHSRIPGAGIRRCLRH